MCKKKKTIKGLVYRVCHDCDFDFDRDVSTAHCRSVHQAIVSIYGVGLFLPPWLLVIGVSPTSPMVSGFRSKALLDRMLFEV